MKAGATRMPWWCWLAASSFLLSAPELCAQYRYSRETQYEFQWLDLHIPEIFAGLEVEGQSETSELRTGGTSYHRDYLYVAPTLGLELEGSVYHPNLLHFDVKTEDGASWQQQYVNVPTGTTPAGTESKWQFLGRYNAEVDLLREKPYATILTAYKDHNFVQYDFFNRATLDTEGYGARSGYAAGPVPFTVGFRHRVDDISSYTRPTRLDETTLSFDAHNDRARDAKTTLSYQFEDYTRREFGIPLEKGKYHTVNVLDTENFGSREQVKLNSILFYNNLETLTIPTESLNLQEHLFVEHSPRLESDYLYTFDDRSLGTTDSLAHSGQATLRHRLYDNLVSSIDIHANTLDSTSPGSSLSDFRYGVGWGEAYTRHLSTWGRLTLGNNLRYDLERRETTGQSIAIIQEPHTLTDGVITYLNQPRVVASSVRVTDSTGREYQPLLDYILVEHGQLMEIRRAPGATQIPNGGAILVDYQVLLPPSDDFSTLSEAVSVRLDLFDNLLGFYARLNLVQNYGGENLVLQNIFDKVVGVEFSWRWARAGAEYEMYDSNLAPFETKRLFQSLTFDLGDEASLSFNFDETWTTFGDTGIQRQSYDAIARFRSHFTPYLSWDLEGGVRADRGPGFDQTLFVARTGLEYVRGQLSVKLGYDFQDQDYLGDRRERHFFFLRLRRKF